MLWGETTDGRARGGFLATSLGRSAGMPTAQDTPTGSPSKRPDAGGAKPPGGVKPPAQAVSPAAVSQVPPSPAPGRGPLEASAWAVERGAVERPLGVKFHKGDVQLQFDLRLPYVEVVEGKRRSHAGSVLLQLAKSAVGRGEKMDWENALTMKLGLPDLMKLGAAFHRGGFDKVDLFHNSDAGHPSSAKRSTTLIVTPGQRPDTFRWTLTRRAGNDKDERVIYLGQEELYGVKILIDAAIARIMGWA